MRDYNPTKNTTSWKNKLALIAGLVILIFILVSIFTAWQKSSKINQEIASLETEIQDIEKNNLETTKLIEYFNSDVYIEEKARVDLGLKKEGEKVVVIPELLKQEMAELENAEKTKLSLNIQPKSNPTKWWQHFFQ